MRKNMFPGVVLITLGVLFLLNNLGVADFGDIVREYWPLILVLWGLSILRRSKSPPRHDSSPSSQGTDRELLHESNVFGDTFLNVTSQSFKGGSISTVFGDCDIDLSQADVAEGEHELRLHSVFGDTSINLPKDAAISVTASSTLGKLTVLGQRKNGFSSEVHVASPNYESSSKRLKISLSKVFGDTRVG